MYKTIFALLIVSGIMLSLGCVAGKEPQNKTSEKGWLCEAGPMLDSCQTNADCKYIDFTGGCKNPKYVGECLEELTQKGISPAQAHPREGASCTCENNRCITHG